MTNVKELEIPIVFHNYKLLQEKQWVLRGSHVYFIQGPNKVGKTSFLTALQGAMTAKDITEKKVSINENGEDSGHYEFTIPDANGDMVTIRNEFTDEKNKFIAIKADGEKVSKVGDIRQMFNYTPINVSEFFQMSRSADGRRRQRNIILKLLPDDARAKFVEADLSETHYFTQRTETGRQLEIAKGYKESTNIPDEDKKLLSQEDHATKLLKLYKDAVTLRENNADLQERRDEQETEKKRLQKLIDDIDTKLKGMVALKEDKITVDLSLEVVEKRITNGKEIIRRINEIKAKNTLLTESTERVKILTNTHSEQTLKIEARRKIKAEIVVKSDLPVSNISFEDDYLVIDDFKFDETQICESDAVLLLANILAKINPGPIQVIGDASVLDAEKLEQLNKIAEDNNKVMFVDEVVRDSKNIVVVGYDMITKIPSKNAKTTKSTGNAKTGAKKAKATDPKRNADTTKEKPEAAPAEYPTEDNKDDDELLF